jgi:hypothetical protein
MRLMNRELALLGALHCLDEAENYLYATSQKCVGGSTPCVSCNAVILLHNCRDKVIVEIAKVREAK